MIRPGVREYFRLRPDPERLAQEVEEEIAFHLEQRAQYLMGLGMEPEVARAEAQRRFGAMERANLILHRSATRREYKLSIREWLMDWRKDFAYNARSLAREPLVSIVVIVTLALGIGANATMFGIIDHLLLRGPAHIVNAKDVGRVYLDVKGFTGEKTTKYAEYTAYTALRDHTRSFAGVAAYGVQTRRIGKGQASREIPVGTSTWDMFPLLGVQPALGRFYTREEDQPPQGKRVAVIDYGMWQQEYGGTRDVIGKTITISERDFTIIGVAPKRFTGPELRPVSVWVPMSAGWMPTTEWATSWCCQWLHVVTRLKPGVTAEVAAADAQNAYRAAATEAKNKRASTAGVSVLPLGYGDDGAEPAEAAVTRWLGGVSLIVLIVACANVINLLLARSVRRRREVSIRLAMGISRRRLMRLLLSESLLLALAGGIAAIALAYWGGQFIRATLLPDLQWGAPVNGRVLLFSAAVTLIAGVVVGLAPALQSSGQDLNSTLKATSHQTGGQRRSNLRDSLTVLQAALSLVLLVGAGLFVRSLMKIDGMDLGLNADRVLAVWSSLPADPSDGDDWQKAQAREELFNRMAMERLLSRPDIAGATLALGTPLQGSFGVDLFVPGFDSIPEQPGGGPFISAVHPSYFKTVGTSVLKGRTFDATDGKGTAPVVVVNETMARTLWPNDNPMTKCLIIAAKDAPCATVIGVVEDVHRTSLREEQSFQYYVPLGQERSISGTQLLVAPRGDAAAFIETLRSQLFDLAPNANFFMIDVLEKRLDPQIRPWRLGATLFLAFGALALLISGIGLFSVIAYSVTQRRTELGIRMALGAQARSMVTLVLRQGVALAVTGILIGVLLTLIGSRFIEPLLFETDARDLATIAAVSVILLVTTIVACVLPAARAGRVDPVEALRSE